MKKSILIGVMCVLMMVVLTVLGIFDFPYKRLIFSLVSIIMFVGFGYLLRIMNPRMKFKKFFRLSGLSFRDAGVVIWGSVVLISGCFLLNVLISFLGSLWGIPISSGTYSDFTGENYLTMVLTVALLPAVFEELFFRGAVLSTLDTYGTVPSVFISSAFFVLMHGLDWFFLSTFFAGIVFAVTVKITQSVFSSMIIHFLNNIMTYVLAVYSSRLKAVELDKFMIYTVILAFLVGLYFIVATILKRYKRKLHRERNILNEGEIIWEREQRAQGNHREVQKSSK